MLFYSPKHPDRLWGQLSHWVPGTLSWQVKAAGCEGDHWASFTAKVKVCGDITPFPSMICGMVRLSTGTSAPLL